MKFYIKCESLARKNWRPGSTVVSMLGSWCVCEWVCRLPRHGSDSTLTSDVFREVSLASALALVRVSFLTWNIRRLLSYLVRDLNAYLMDGFENVLNSFLKILLTRDPYISVSSSQNLPLFSISPRLLSPYSCSTPNHLLPWCCFPCSPLQCGLFLPFLDLYHSVHR